MKSLLSITAVLEAATGMALLLLPAVTASLLLGPLNSSPVGLVVARIAGAALIAIGIACWLVRRDEASHRPSSLVAAILFYNIVTAAVLVHSATALHLGGAGLWPAVVLHIGMAIWCMVSLWPPKR